MRRAIVTGFQPFGPYQYNPVQDVAREYDGRKLRNIEIVGLVLPSTYYGAFKLLSEEIDRLTPEIVISSGLASSVQRIRLEVLGKNMMNGKYPDADGLKPEYDPIAPGGINDYATSADNDLLVDCLMDENIPAELSFDAGRYICNSLIYLTARRIHEEKLPIRFAFFHTPWTEDYLDRIMLEEGKITIKKDMLRKTIEVLVNNA